MAVAKLYYSKDEGYPTKSSLETRTAVARKVVIQQKNGGNPLAAVKTFLYAGKFPTSLNIQWNNAQRKG